MKQNKAAILLILEVSTFSNHSFSMDTKNPFNPASEEYHHIYILAAHFNHYIVPVPIPGKIAQDAVNAVIHHRISKLGLRQYLITDKGTENLNSKMKNCCTMLRIRHSPKSSHAPWTNGLVGVQYKNL